jgi:hypothetical protein
LNVNVSPTILFCLHGIDGSQLDVVFFQLGPEVLTRGLSTLVVVLVYTVLWEGEG